VVLAVGPSSNRWADVIDLSEAGILQGLQSLKSGIANRDQFLQKARLSEPSLDSLALTSREAAQYFMHKLFVFNILGRADSRNLPITIILREARFTCGASLDRSFWNFGLEFGEPSPRLRTSRLTFLAPHPSLKVAL
jgi:hypothetical protein